MPRFPQIFVLEPQIITLEDSFLDFDLSHLMEEEEEHPLFTWDSCELGMCPEGCVHSEEEMEDSSSSESIEDEEFSNLVEESHPSSEDGSQESTETIEDESPPEAEDNYSEATWEELIASSDSDDDS